MRAVPSVDGRDPIYPNKKMLLEEFPVFTERMARRLHEEKLVPYRKVGGQVVFSSRRCSPVSGVTRGARREGRKPGSLQEARWCECHRTALNYGRIFRHHILPVLGDTLIGDIKPSTVRNFVNHLEKQGSKPGTVRNVFCINQTRAIFGQESKAEGRIDKSRAFLAARHERIAGC